MAEIVNLRDRPPFAPTGVQTFADGADRVRLSDVALKAFRAIVDHWGLVNSEAAALLGVSSAAVTKRRGKGGLIAFKHKEDWRYPRWQFDGAAVLPGAIAVWKVLPDRHDVAGLVRWFTLPTRQLSGRTPEQALRDGDVDDVIDAASYVGSR